MNSVFLALGGNLGNTFKNIETALDLIENKVGVIVRTSSIYETEPWGKSEQPNFLNLVVELSTNYSAQETLDKIQKIETELGRIRKEKWGTRTIDIDILFYNDDIIKSERLTVPHPLMQERKFVLIPLAEIAADFIHPILKQKIKQLLLSCADHLNAHKFNKPLK